jgi:hypothetical protein
MKISTRINDNFTIGLTTSFHSSYAYIIFTRNLPSFQYAWSSVPKYLTVEAKQVQMREVSNLHPPSSLLPISLLRRTTMSLLFYLSWYICFRHHYISPYIEMERGYLAGLAYEGVSKSIRTGRLERALQMVQLLATRCSYINILWVSLVSFAAITHCVASQRVFIVVVYFVIDSVRKIWIHPRICNTQFNKLRLKMVKLWAVSFINNVVHYY